jgi:aminoglycoside phosphotransferase (APT) family kinase protein
MAVLMPGESDQRTLTEPATPGIDVTNVTAWLLANIPGTVAPFDFDLVAGGRSNLTFKVTDKSGHEMVLRRPPLGNVLQSAHDMGREHRIISALFGTPVPVPKPLGHCTDPEVNGAPFYVMDFVDGAIVRNEQDAVAAFPESARPTIADSVVDVLAEMHSLEPADVGLGDLGRREGYIERQLRRWHRQFTDSKSRDIEAVEEVHRRLAARVPEQQRVSLVHGDYRIDNVVLGADGKVSAVLDWELCTLGDPLADVGVLLLNWVQPGEPTEHMVSGTPTALGGFKTREEILARYADHAGLDVSGIDYYVAFGYWKLACIVEGIYARYSSGAMGDSHDMSSEKLANQVVLLAEAALAVLERPDERLL